jgi:tetratricopeptide (TPR) repeat protein
MRISRQRSSGSGWPHLHVLGAMAIVSLAVVPGVLLADPGDALDTGGGGSARRYLVHARAAMEQGRLTEALTECDRAIADYPAYMRAHFDRGRALLAGGQNDAAIAEFTTVLAAHPEYPMVYVFRGTAYLRARRTSEAIVDLNRAVQAQVGIGPVMYAHTLVIRSLAWELLGEADPALADFDHGMRAINGDTFNDYKVLNDRCYTAAIVGLLDSAGESCDESISRHPRDESVYDSRGMVDLMSHKWDQAIADYTQALYYRPELPTSLYGRGLAKRAKGDSAGAASDIAVAQQGEPHIVDIMARLGVPASVTEKVAKSK